MPVLAFAQWQGKPYSDGYDARERESIALETRATRESLTTSARNPLLDTTGSVIYTDADVLERMSADWFIVYIKAAPEHLDRLKDQYFAQPKPLAWNGHYEKHAGKSETQSLRLSYPKLLDSRDRLYAEIADHVISSTDILTPNAARLFDLIKPAR